MTAPAWAGPVELVDVYEDEDGDAWYVQGHDAPDDVLRLSLALLLWDNDTNSPAPFTTAAAVSITRGWWRRTDDDDEYLRPVDDKNGDKWTLLQVLS